MERLSKSKKGQLNSLAPAIITLVIASVVLVVGIIMVDELVDQRAGSDTSGTFTNQTLTMNNVTGITGEIVQSDVCGYSSWNATQVMNTSVHIGVLTEGTDFGIHANGSIYNLTRFTDPVSLLASGTYVWGGESCVAGNLTVVGLGTFADFWEIIILAVVIGIVIGLLLVVFGRTRRR